MINTKLTRKAMIIAYEAHKNQTDKSGVPYIYHPIHVAEQMNTENECIIALLHDVVEDTNVTFKQLEEVFSKEIIDILKLLTREENIEYDEYIKRIKNNSIACKVKIADLTHYLDKTRLVFVSEVDVKRNEKYKKDLQILYY